MKQRRGDGTSGTLLLDASAVEIMWAIAARLALGKEIFQNFTDKTPPRFQGYWTGWPENANQNDVLA